MKATTGRAACRSEGDAHRRRYYRACRTSCAAFPLATMSSITPPRWPARPDRTSRKRRPFVKECVSWGAGPRASQYLVLGAKARAALYGRYYATSEDVAAVALPVLRHRILTNFNADAEA